MSILAKFFIFVLLSGMVLGGKIHEDSPEGAVTHHQEKRMSCPFPCQEAPCPYDLYPTGHVCPNPWQICCPPA